MAHKTITISEEAYNLLKSLKKDNESFTEVIKRIAGQKRDKNELLSWLSQNNENDELADSVKSVYDQRKTISLRTDHQ